MPHGSAKSRQVQEIDESLLNHLFLPLVLPSSGESDFCLRSNHRNESVLLECLRDFLDSFAELSQLPIVVDLRDCVRRWCVLQTSADHLFVSRLQSSFDQLSSGAFLPLYFHTQNATILVEIDGEEEALISAWQVLLPIETLRSSFPVPVSRLSDRSQLRSTVHCQLLLDLLQHPVEPSKDSHYVCQWWMQRFSDAVPVDRHSLPSFTKKHRDQVRWNSGSAPFRRSGLWMSIKVVLQTILTKRLGTTRGTRIYKLLIARFLTEIIYTRAIAKSPPVSVDLLVHCIRKITRRLTKLTLSDADEWVRDIRKKIEQILPKLDWQTSIQVEEELKNCPMTFIVDPEIYRHRCEPLKTYLNTPSAKKPLKTTFNGDTNSPEDVHLVPSFKVLTSQYNYTVGNTLTQMETWLVTRLDQWIDQPPSSNRETDQFQIFARFFDDYQSRALDHYRPKTASSDPIGYSRFLLTSLTLICVMHQKLCLDQRFERLKEHRLDLPNVLDLFEYLLLPTRDEMSRARHLFEYFHRFTRQSHPDLLSDIEAENSFGVQFAEHSTKINNVLRKIQAQVEVDREAKVQEVRNAKDKFNRLMHSISGSPCTCYNEPEDRFCRRCRIEQQAKDIDVSIYECPIPSERASALAVLFELRMPMEIRSYRDVLWQFVNRSSISFENRKYEWLRVLPHAEKLQPHFTGPNDLKVKLVSSTNSIKQTHRATPPIASASIDEFLYPNSLQVELSPAQCPGFDDERRLLTPRLLHPDYEQLQYSIESTEFVQNRVMAHLQRVEQKLKPKQWIEFGSFRSGHRLQWWNLFTLLEMDSLSLNEESVAILLQHAILQYGPVTENPALLVSSWCSEAHEPLLDDRFVDQLINKLNSHLDAFATNWQNELALMVITMITMRILTLCNDTREDEVAKLALKCRRTGEKWLDLISVSIPTISRVGFEKVQDLRRTMSSIGVTCLLTFSTHTNRLPLLLSSNQHVLSLLKAVTNVHDNSIVAKKSQTPTHPFRRDLIRLSERVLVQLQPTLAELLQRMSYRSLDDFARIYWPVLRNDNAKETRWKKRHPSLDDGWYDGHFGSTCLSIDCSHGAFLVNGMSIGYLPEKILSTELYRRVFGDYIFQVQVTDSPNTYITKYAYHADGQVQYEFHFNEELNRLIVRERHVKTQGVFELIPPKCFENDLPVNLVSEFSHWKDTQRSLIEFRPIHFTDPDFLTSKSFVFNIETGYVLTSTDQVLLNRSSAFFQNLFTRYFGRLDENAYVYMLRENLVDSQDSETAPIIHIHLPRLAIAFKYNLNSQILMSREYPDMCIDPDQWLGTLTGLRSGLLLSPVKSSDQYHGMFKSRKLIVPFGRVLASRRSADDHQIVTIERKSSMSHAHHYFVFVLNDRLRIIQSTDSPTGWLYLALLHAMTSHPLPDRYTGMTGMERAFQLLNSAGCWTDQPFDPLALNILHQIAAISPKIHSYRPSVSSAAKIEWNPHGIRYSLQHAGYSLLAKKLIEASLKLNFMHPSPYPDAGSALIDEQDSDERLLIKLYWDYRHCHNPLVRLSAEIEAELLSTSDESSYAPTLGYRPSTGNNEQTPRVNLMYQSGDVRLKNVSELGCFPLNKWLTSEYAGNSIWIGLLQQAESLKGAATTASHDDLERYELLLDFLHYIAVKNGMRPFYLRILITVLKDPTKSLKSIVFPPFAQYKNVQQVSVTPSAIDFNARHSASERRVITEELRDCLDKGSFYKDQCRLATSEEKHQIKLVLTSWQLNRRLQAFLVAVQTLVDSWTLNPFNDRVSVDPQRFVQKPIDDDDRIERLSNAKEIDPELLRSAQCKYHHRNSVCFVKSTVSLETDHQRREFPTDIFSALDDDTSHLSDIGHSFKNHLAASWAQLQSSETFHREYPTEEEIIELLESSRRESTQFWEELLESVTSSDPQLFQVGLAPRVIPSVLIPLFEEIWRNEEKPFLTKDQCTLLGGILVNWTVEQQFERALHFSDHGQREEFEKELSNSPHVNWTPSEHLPWLIFELEMNITIRQIQVDVARHMNEPRKDNIVMQMNMGEGKTSVIIPMLALTLGSSLSNLVRVVVLKSLFPMNHQLLRYKLGGLLNRRVLPFACRRDMDFNHQQATQISARLQQALRRGDVVLVSPEDLLSFDLLTIDKCRQHDFDTGRSMLTTQSWLGSVARDILDESDEILHCKYQLIYTVGRQQQMDGGIERWKLIQWVLHCVKRCAAEIARDDQSDTYFQSSERPSGFPQFRLLSHRPFPALCTRIANEWLNRGSYRKTDQQQILSFILDIQRSVDVLLDRFSPDEIQSLLLLRGLLSGEVLFVALQKRYRVNFGINPHSTFNRLMAVPFRAKDVPAERTEFGHPDMALVLTQLTYYYSGLTDGQMLQCLDRLSREERHPESIYAEWIDGEEESDVPHSIKQWKGVNLKDCERETREIFRTLRFNLVVIDYFLNHFVFPREARQFPHRLVSSGWDLSSPRRTKIITGFSGTNDTQLLLPAHIRQCDLPQLQKTDAVVLDHLLQPENGSYRYFPVNATSAMILNDIVNSEPTINVILDVGALLVDGTNREIAVQWLKLSEKSRIDYAVYFDSNRPVVCDRQFHHHSFSTSPASERLDRCVIYLDEVHTRGTDFKFPHGFKAAVTLGNGLTKDRFVQACMRMRKLGGGHSLTFWSSDEVHRQIVALKRHSQHCRSETEIYNQKDILRWVYGNTQHATWDGLHHWSIQSLSYQRKLSASQSIQPTTGPPMRLSDQVMGELADQCLEPEMIALEHMYGVSKALQTLPEIYLLRYQQSNLLASEELHKTVLERLDAYGGSKQRLSQFLDDEQQRELEQEVEQEQEREKEEEQKRVRPVRPCEPILHNEIKRLCQLDDAALILKEFPSVFRPLAYAFTDSAFAELCQPDSWQPTFWISTEFQRVIERNEEASNPSFLRPPRWMIVYRNEHVIFVSAFEANWLMGQLNYLFHREDVSEPPMTISLRLLLPRVKPNQSILVNTPIHGAMTFILSVEWLAELFVFNGTLYFETEEEQTAYCHCLALCPKPRTLAEEEAFETAWITVDGFVADPKHRQQLQIRGARFNSNPLKFVKQLLEHRNNAYTPVASHVGSLVYDTRKILLK